ncbi:nuclear envelope pore membrane protein POM 121C-like isoform X2 [Patiria miniata]|uniref:Uncharacterized protein n=1 Tax=Patiria miniata TaxID=46514 RepID=A0A914BJ68_PATMI|nr:nuclear envelope pore membrane protein POM 121C-like isoform X2 [Patiria miniata]
MRWTGDSCRLLALCGILIPLCLVYILKFSVLSALLLCIILGVSILVLKIAGKANNVNGVPRNIPHASGVKGHAGPTDGGLVKTRETIFPVRPTPRTSSSLKETEFRQKSVYSGTDYDKSGWAAQSKHFPLSPILSTELGPPQTQYFSQTRSPMMTAASGFVSPVYSMANMDSNLTRSPLSTVRSPAWISPVKSVKNIFPNSSPQHMKPPSKVPLQSDLSSKATVFPLSNRHFPTHQPDYTRTNMGILPASSIFFGDGAAANSLSPLRRGGRVRTHSPVTVKIARPDKRRSASPLFQRLSLERSSGSPLHKETIMAALNEKRKRLAVDDQDDSSSVASSAGGQATFAKRRRLDNGSRCSTPSLASSSNYSTLVNGDADSSADEQARIRFKTAWMGARGLETRTPRNAIDSSISSSRRAAIAIHMMRKRMLLQPAEPESSPSKKSLLPNDDTQSPNADKTHQPSNSFATTGPKVANQIGESDSERQEATSKDRSSSSEDGTPTKAAGKNLGASRLKTPKMRSLGQQMLRNSSPPGEYTAADLEEDRHLAKQRVNYILESLKDGEEEANKNLPKDKEPSTSVGFVAPLTPLVSAKPAVSSSTLTSSNLLQLSRMKTLPVSAVQTGQLLLPSAKTDSGGAVKDNQALTKRTSAPAASTQQTEAATQKGVTFGIPLTQGSSAAMTQATPATAAMSSSALGFTVVDSSKSGASMPSVGQVPQKDPLLKGILAGYNPTTTATSVGFGLEGATTNVTPGLMTMGKPGGTDQAGLGQAAPKQSLGGLLSQGTPIGGFSLGSNAGQPQASQGALAQTSTATRSLQGSTTSTSLIPQSGASGGMGLMTAPSSAPPIGTGLAASSGFQFGAPTSVAASSAPSVAAPSAPTFGSALQGASTASTAPSPFQFGAPTPITQSIAGFQMPSSTPATVSASSTSGIQFGNPTLKTEAQSSTPFMFGSVSSTTAKTTAPTLSFGGAASSLGGQTGLTSAAAASGLFNPTTAASSSVFGSATTTAAATKPSFTPAFGQTVSAAPAQPSAPAFNFGAQPQSSSTTSGGFQFQPAFGAPPQTQPSQSQQQASMPTFQFGSGMTSQPTATAAASSGGFAFNPAPATSSSSVFGAGATAAATAAASPFQSGMSGAAGGIFGQQPATQAPSFGAATAQPTNAFGGPTPGQSVFGGQPTAPAPSTGGFNFGAPAASQTNSSTFSFGATGGFGTPAPSAAPSFGGVTPTNTGSFTLGMGSTANPKRVSRMTQQRRNRRR